MSRLAPWLLLACCLLTACNTPASNPIKVTPTPSPTKLSTPHSATFVGSARCTECHTDQVQDWETSHHFQAMQEATEQSVRGDFDNAEFDYFGFRSLFFKKGQEFWVQTDGPSGVSQKYQVSYTFGFEPLQQYLIRVPDGRLQALSIAWDTEKKRWFHLHPTEQITAKSSLHWTAPQYNWNFMCAECHSTGLEKNYEPSSDTYHTSYKEVNVSCEACHGPASSHLASVAGENLPNHGFLTSLEGRGPWTAQTETSPPRPAHPTAKSGQVESCARCHARGSVIGDPYEFGQPLGETHAAAVLSADLYHADGQIDEEVFEYGSFLQSKMYHAGVVCTDCHNPHTDKLKLKLKGDNLCLSCHRPQTYATLEHSHHQTVSCVDCHMPGKLYMGNDFRRDHSFRIPRPDLSAELGSPNACNTCHQDRSVEWAAEAYKTWYPEQPAHYGQLLKRARDGDPTVREPIAQLAADKTIPEIVRATAVSLAPYPEVLQAALADSAPLVRREAVSALEGAPTEVRSQLLLPLAADPVRMVRVQVGRMLADLGLSDPQVTAAVEEYRRSLELNSDRTEGRLGLAALQLQSGDAAAAEKSLQEAVKRDPRSPMAYVNLADLYRGEHRDEEGERVLRSGLATLAPAESAALHHALGLLLVRRQDRAAALEHLKKASDLASEDSRYAFIYAVALNDAGQTKAAIKRLEVALKGRPDDPQLLSTMISFLESVGDTKGAKKYRERLKL